MDSILSGQLRASIFEGSEDYKAETISAGLVDAGFPAEQIVVQAKGVSKRSVRKDVSDFHTEVNEAYDAEFLFLETNREGIYDGLPEAVFHQTKNSSAASNKYEVMEEMRRHREEEAAARKFFLPFEQEYHHIKRMLYEIETEFESVCDTSRLVSLFSSKWPILQKLEPRQAYLFFRMIPMLHEIRDDFPLVAHSMRMLLQVPVEIVPYVRAISYDASLSCSLGEGLLGIDTIIGVCAEDGEIDVLMKVGPFEDRIKYMVGEDTNHGAALYFNSVSVEQFVTGGSKEGLMEELCGYFFGAQYDIAIEFMCPEAACVLEGEAMLGVNAVI